jgi:hypothetical protein
VAHPARALQKAEGDMSEIRLRPHQTPTVLVKVRPGRVYVKGGRQFVSGELLRLRPKSADAAIREGHVEKAIGTNFVGRDNQKESW